MTMMTVDDLARDLKVRNEDLLPHLVTMGYEVEGPESPLVTDDPAALRAQLVTVLPQREVVEKRIKPTVIRRRMKQNPAADQQAFVDEAESSETVQTQRPRNHVEDRPSGQRPSEPQKKPFKKIKKPEPARIIEMAPRPQEPQAPPPSKPASKQEVRTQSAAEPPKSEGKPQEENNKVEAREAAPKPAEEARSEEIPAVAAKSESTEVPESGGLPDAEASSQVPVQETPNKEDREIKPVLAEEPTSIGLQPVQMVQTYRPENRPRPLDEKKLLEDRPGKKKKKKEKRMQPAQIIGKVELRKEPPKEPERPERPAERPERTERVEYRPERVERTDRSAAQRTDRPAIRTDRPHPPRFDRPSRPPGERPGERPPSERFDKGERPGERSDRPPARPERPGPFGVRKPEPLEQILADAREEEKRKNRKKERKPKESIDEKVEADGAVKRRKEVVLKNDLYDERSRPGRLRSKAKKIKRKTELTIPKAIKRRIKIPELITVAGLAHKMSTKGAEVVQFLIGLGVTATINEALDYETAALAAAEFGFEAEHAEQSEQDLLPAAIADTALNLVPRPPVITVMGHVDHGKTSLLDAIRSTHVTDHEAGGITQHIGAYKVKAGKGELVFLDTPGHEAFTAMRARGAQVTDFVILVVAADDGVMDQTVEAINHARAANVPIIVAVNKIDKPEADRDRVLRELANHELIPEAWGGDTLFTFVSAKNHQGIDEFLDLILLQAEVMELKANPDKRAIGTVIEARLDKGKGAVATVLIKEGTLKLGDPFIAGIHHGKVRAMLDHEGKTVEEAGPATPVEVQGFSSVPEAGEPFMVVEEEKIARQIGLQRHQKQREHEASVTGPVSLENLLAKMQEQQVKELNLIIKADVQGSVEAVKEALSGLSAQEIKVKVIHTGVGGITESDVMLASASGAIIIGFNVRPVPKVTQLAEQEKVDLRLYTIIYEAIEDVRKAMEGMLAPIERESVTGRAEIRQTFHVARIGTIAGCHVTSGKIERSSQVRLLRDNVVIYTGRILSMKRFKDDIKEAVEGYECGITLENYKDVKMGDVIEAFTIERETAKLTP